MDRKTRIRERLSKLYSSAPVHEISKEESLLILSDLHVGDGSRQDDFRTNAPLVETVLRDYYLPGGYSLILNGDIEELQKFSLKAIIRRWESFYRLLQEFQDKARLIKIAGNHDAALAAERRQGVQREIRQAFRLSYRGQNLLILHGHQATGYYLRFNRWVGLFLKYIARPLGFKNRTPGRDSRKRYSLEKRLYRFAADRKIAVLMGHTHRPLFESFSKADKLRIEMESLLRRYEKAPSEETETIEGEITRVKESLDRILDKQGFKQLRSSLYTRGILVPALFNSGCCIGKRGITGLEISQGRIRLVHWYDPRRSGREDPAPHTEGPYRRMVIDEDSLDYIFARIRLLT